MTSGTKKRTEQHEFLERIKHSECEHQWYWDYACSSEPPYCLKCGLKSEPKVAKF